jgi:hypothetical protein
VNVLVRRIASDIIVFDSYEWKARAVKVVGP